MLPKDPAILLSVVNTKLRDDYADLEDLCAAEDVDRAELVKNLEKLGYRYHAQRRQFICDEFTEYLKKGGTMMSDCLFCKIAAGEIPSDKLYEDELCYAFSDIAPQAPSHFLVIPKSHIASVSQIDGSNSALVAHIFEVIAKLTAEKGIGSYRVVSNIGDQAGQSVPHLHFHVLGGRDMTWPPG